MPPVMPTRIFLPFMKNSLQESASPRPALSPLSPDSRLGSGPAAAHTTRMDKHSIKDWPAGERPRERLVGAGPTQLSDAELLAVMLGRGVRGHSALELARSL